MFSIENNPQSSNRDEPVVPANEAQARELVPLLSTPADLNEVWERSLAQHGDQPTAKDIKEVRESWMGKTKKELVAAVGLNSGAAGTAAGSR
jgi:hypothetical protein